MPASPKVSLKEVEDSIARLKLRLEQYEIHMARSGFSDRAVTHDLKQTLSAYERAKVVRDEIMRGVAKDGVGTVA